MIKKYAVQSSNIKAIGYDEEEKILEVDYLNGSSYKYYDIPQEVFLGFRTAESIGKYLNERVKKKGYKYTKILED